MRSLFDLLHLGKTVAKVLATYDFTKEEGVVRHICWLESYIYKLFGLQLYGLQANN